MWFEGKRLQNQLRADKNESRSVLAVDIQGHQRGGFCIVPRKYSMKKQYGLKAVLLQTSQADDFRGWAPYILNKKPKEEARRKYKVNILSRVTCQGFNFRAKDWDQR